MSHKNEWFMLLEFVFVCVYQIPKLQFSDFGVYGVLDVHSTKIKHNSSVMDVCDGYLRQYLESGYVIVSSFTLLFFVRQVVTQMRRNLLFTHTYGSRYQSLFGMIYVPSIFILNFWWIYFPPKITYMTSSFTLPSVPDVFYTKQQVIFARNC